ncbi:MAG: sulfurtransferase TusA family protein [Deltaproteobacteria bacterium]|nr:sulfurtransferase TusA family protein [Candidatus Zymogenaceae bacterium]
MTKTVDARGLSCPQPVIMTRKAVKDLDGGEVTVLVDTMTQVQNVSRSAKKLGWDVSYEEKGDTFELVLKK